MNVLDDIAGTLEVKVWNSSISNLNSFSELQLMKPSLDDPYLTHTSVMFAGTHTKAAPMVISISFGTRFTNRQTQEETTNAYRMTLTLSQIEFTMAARVLLNATLFHDMLVADLADHSKFEQLLCNFTMEDIALNIGDFGLDIQDDSNNFEIPEHIRALIPTSVHLGHSEILDLINLLQTVPNQPAGSSTAAALNLLERSQLRQQQSSSATPSRSPNARHVGTTLGSGEEAEDQGKSGRKWPSQMAILASVGCAVVGLVGAVAVWVTSRKGKKETPNKQVYLLADEMK
jgi:hypothetical protein